MNRLQRRDDIADVRRFGAPQILVTFITMAIAEWRKLVAEVQHALSSHRRHRDAAERELFHGRYKLMSKNDDDLPVI
jgi:hypothetical protein